MTKDRPVLDVSGLVVEYPAGRRRKVSAVSDVGFRIEKGETLGLVGESGCGKSSVARAVMQLPRPAAGTVRFKGEDLGAVDKHRLRRLRPKFQMIFQDAMAALNPRRKVGETIAMPLKTVPNQNGCRDPALRRRRTREMMGAVGLDPDAFDLRPFQFSGGQCQRIQIARALITQPELLVCDEPVASLDVSVQAQIINLLEDMRTRYGLAMLFISHDLAVVKNVCDRVAVMYSGKLCEIGPSDRLYQAPAHPYTQALLSAVLEPASFRRSSKTRLFSGEMPSPLEPPSGCRFRTRCLQAAGICAEKPPELRRIAPSHKVACHWV